MEELRNRMQKINIKDQTYQSSSDETVNGFNICKFRNLGCDFAVPAVKEHEIHSCRYVNLTPYKTKQN